ncbi:MAG: hypothetical protein BGN88_02460 [Clostridiales bacterium 43-6]|nr:MAG: hypothetical protein BGN88_02460 [Clostridiales bacterium 43-6]
MDINSKLKNYDYKTIPLIEKHMKNITDKYKVKINFHDVFGIYEGIEGVKRLFTDYYYHNNEFCNFLKKKDTCYFTCLATKRKILEKCEKTGTPFYGICPFGVEEYVFPILNKNRLYAFFCIGQFYSDRDVNLERLRSASLEYGFDAAIAESKYCKVCKRNTMNFDEFVVDMNILCKLVLQLYNEYGYEYYKGYKMIEHVNNNTIKNAIFFIDCNFDKNISLRDVANASFCNPSYLSSTFKTKMNMTVTDYINYIRIKNAKYLLDCSTESITEIAYKVGFNDSAYFTRVYKKLMGLSPKEYRNNP